jgi:hypothetical protein
MEKMIRLGREWGLRLLLDKKIQGGTIPVKLNPN